MRRGAWASLPSASLTASNGGYRRLARAARHGRREIIKATPKAGSPVTDAVLSRIAELYRIEESIRNSDAKKRRLVRQDAPRPLVPALGDGKEGIEFQINRSAT